MADYYRDYELCNWTHDDWAHDPVFDDLEAWHTKDGRTLSIENMTDTHVQHTLVFLKKNKGEWWRIEQFENELKRRGLTVLHAQDDWMGGRR